jgi:hypothetical protein
LLLGRERVVVGSVGKLTIGVDAEGGGNEWRNEAGSKGGAVARRVDPSERARVLIALVCNESSSAARMAVSWACGSAKENSESVSE